MQRRRCPLNRSRQRSCRFEPLGNLKDLRVTVSLCTLPAADRESTRGLCLGMFALASEYQAELPILHRADWMLKVSQRFNRYYRHSGSPERTAMLRSLLLAPSLAMALAACISTPHYRTTKAVNTALTGACLAAQLYPCTIEPSAADKAKAAEAKATAVRAKAQVDSAAADQNAARRSSCLADTGPRLAVSASQCATYVPKDSGKSGD